MPVNLPDQTQGAGFSGFIDVMWEVHGPEQSMPG